MTFTVSTRHTRFCALVLLACWQVLLASGDDFNLARFVFSPAESSTEDLLPLDDPNCDFMRSSETRTLENSGRDKGGNPPSLLLQPAAMHRTLPTASRLPSQLSRLCFHTPLRC